MATANAVGMEAQSRLVERRAHDRIKVAVPVELRADGSEQILRLETSDISLGGCYVPMIFTLEVGRMVEVSLTVKHHTLAIRGVVVSRHPRRGNGIMFLEMEREDRIRLQNFLKTVLDTSLNRPN
jgi:c-di-GMP-binding flagellar brake protein YcgR